MKEHKSERVPKKSVTFAAKNPTQHSKCEMSEMSVLTIKAISLVAIKIILDVMIGQESV